MTVGKNEHPTRKGGRVNGRRLEEEGASRCFLERKERPNPEKKKGRSDQPFESVQERKE